MSESLITYKTAMLAKSCGCSQSFWPENFYTIADCAVYRDMKACCFDKDIHVAAHSQQSLRKWIRETYNIFVQIEMDQTMEPKFVHKIIRFDTNTYAYVNHNYSDLYYTYEEALEDGLYEALQIIFSEQNNRK